VRSFLPQQNAYRVAEFVRGGLGACAGILVAALVGRAIPGGPEQLPYIVAPIGASAVLLFAAPASPLAQPWPLIGGNVLSSLVGIGVGRIFDDLAVAAAIAVGAAIALMMALRCLHPPGGACALFAAVGAAPIRDHGFAFALWPVGVNSLALLAMALLVNNLTGRRYPHVPETAPPHVEPLPREKVGVQSTDVAQAIAQRDEGLDVMPGDVVSVLRDAELIALDRRLDRLPCAAIMVRQVRVVGPADSIYRARVLMNEHRVTALPVVVDDGRVQGIITAYDLFNLDVADVAPVTSAMTSPVVSVHADAPVADLVPLMTERGFRHVPVVDAQARLLGIITRNELIAVMHQALIHTQDIRPAK
jgi:CBS domain-containing membrane protein